MGNEPPLRVKFGNGVQGGEGDLGRSLLNQEWILFAVATGEADTGQPIVLDLL